MSTLPTFAPPSFSFGEHVSTWPRKSKVAVIGAGAFGGWSALFLQRKGFQVTLIDGWGPGHSRSSSGDETRVIRSTYGANEFYFDLNVRSLTLWKDHQTTWQRPLFYNPGVLWFCYAEQTPVVDESLPFAKKHGMEYEYLSVDLLKKRYPMIHTHDLHHAWFDPFGGYLKAREGTQAVFEAFLKEGGSYLQTYAQPGVISNGELQALRLSNGDQLKADAYLFACGSWLGKLFPDVMGNRITATRQEAYYFGTPQHQSHMFDQMPVWIDADGKDYYYGIPGNAYRGFKLGVDERGPVFDPTEGDRTPHPPVLDKARKFIGHRFPSLRQAPLVESRVCPYENSVDGNFIFESHPQADNVVFLGGGSGHGFKHGPALGELVATKLSGS
jgi:glycine/D-amino acid oxidase-like deaminating enzyme